MVKAALLTPADYITSLEDTFTEEDVTISNVSVVPNTWYRLVVKSYADANGVVLFNVWLNDTKLTGDTALYGTDFDVFPSLLGKSSTTLEAVGFAGEGLVDDLVMTTIDPYATSYDSTLTLGANVSSVSFTIGSDEYMLAAANSPGLYDVYPNDVITIDQVSYADGYEAGAITDEGFLDGVPGYTVGAGDVSISITAVQSVTAIDFTLTLNEGVSSVSFTVDGTPYVVTTTTNISLSAGTVNYTAAFDTANWWTGTTSGSFTVAAAPDNAYTFTATRESGTAVISESTTAGELGITAGAFASSTSAELAKVVDWAVANGKTTSDVNAMAFANALSYTDDEKSYLLDGTNLTESEAAEELEITSIEYVAGTGWVITSKAGSTLGNGRVEIWGATSVAGPYSAGQNGKNFFKAVLVK